MTRSITSLVVVNQRIQKSISILDRGLAYGDGLFETMRIDNEQHNNDILLWQYHYDRLVNGLHRLHINLKTADLHKHIDVTLARIKSEQNNIDAKGVLKLIITRGNTGQGYLPIENTNATLISLFFPFTSEYLQKNMCYQTQGVRVHCCEEKLAIQPSIAGIKSLNQLSYVLASIERQHSNLLQEGLLFTSSGQLIEATARNIFLVKNNEIHTPLLNKCGISGVMRRLIIEYIQDLVGLPVYEVHLTKKNLLLADEVFLSNSVSYVWPIVQCADMVWPIGQITQRVQQAINLFMEQNNTLSLSNFLFE